MQAIVICTVNNPGITVLLESIRCYGDKLPVYLCSNNLGLWARAREITENLIYRPNPATNFGDAYNAAVDYAFEHGKFDSLILENELHENSPLNKIPNLEEKLFQRIQNYMDNMF